MTKFVLGRSIAALAVPSTIAFTEPTALADVGGTSRTIVLPHGLHLGRDGRYYEPVCNPAAPRHCLAERLLPETFRPREHAREAAPGPGAARLGVRGRWRPRRRKRTPRRRDGAGGRRRGVPDSCSEQRRGQDRRARRHARLARVRRSTHVPAGIRHPGAAGVPGGLPDGTTPVLRRRGRERQSRPIRPSTAPAGDGETGLDMAMVSAACPDCSILLVQMTSAIEQGRVPGTSSRHRPPPRCSVRSRPASASEAASRAASRPGTRRRGTSCSRRPATSATCSRASPPAVGARPAIRRRPRTS